MVWYLLIGLSFVTGMLRLPGWTVFVWPAVSIGLGVWAVAAELPNYDVPGFGHTAGVLIVAVGCAVAWVLGRGLAAIVQHIAGNRAPLH